MSNVFVDNDRKIIILQDKIDQESAYNINTSLINMEMNDNEKEENEKNFKRNAIKFYINSFGGDVYAGFSIINTIESMKTKVNTISTGVIESCALNIFLAGEERYISKNVSVMLHGFSLAFAKNTNILEIDEVITHTKEFMLNENKQYILSRTKIPEKTFNEWMENKVTKYFTADEVFHYGIATKYLENI